MNPRFRTAAPCVRLRLAYVSAQVLIALAARTLPAQQEIQRVEVVNLPAVQKVEGSVGIAAPAPHSALVKEERVLVSPGRRTNPSDHLLVARLDASGFTRLVLSLHGRLGHRTIRPGEVGLVLIPDEEELVKAFLEDGQRFFSVEATARVAQSGPVHFAAPQVEASLGFPRYRVYAVNTTDHSVEIDVYAYLVN